ncbi:hypothetical protein Pint_21805 [Pistacia integerrima]|uniref:Uncharacterized protein n=1 Tax=Pistacia integerrima TaxID=434235 RepID=A0ACC0X8T8_9ROSI|nr:hypothetical protein Pint_21805 [Pistacia integerrima]
MTPVKSVRYPVGWLHFTVNFKLALSTTPVLSLPFSVILSKSSRVTPVHPSEIEDDSSAWPPGCGKATVLKALSGNLDKSLKVDVLMYSVLLLFFSKDDRKFPTMVTGWMSLFPRKHLMMMVSKRVEVGIVLDPDVDTYTKVIGLDICAVTMKGSLCINDHAICCRIFSQLWIQVSSKKSFCLNSFFLADFAQIYTASALYEHMKALVRELSTPTSWFKSFAFSNLLRTKRLDAIHIL